MTYQPTTDEEWNWLQRRFAALDFRPGMRTLFDNSLNESPYTSEERRSFRREIFDAIRQTASPREAYPNPYFELTWFRAARADPEIAAPDVLAHNRAVLYDAYYRRDEADRARSAARAEWDTISTIGPGSDLMETVTDGEALTTATE
jgi:hypothetical protein